MTEAARGENSPSRRRKAIGATLETLTLVPAAAVVASAAGLLTHAVVYGIVVAIA